jgi:hypothetical protein
MLLDALMCGSDITLLRRIRLAPLAAFGAVTSRAHGEILTDFRQDGAVRSRSLILLLLVSLTLWPTMNLSEALAAAKPIPSPKPTWPPAGYRGNDGVYAKVPKSKELIGAISAQRGLQKSVANCQEYACGAVFVAAETGCAWWEVNASVRRLDPVTVSKVKIGSLVTYAGGSKSRALKTIILISGESVDAGVSIAGIKVICHRDATDRPKLGNIYNPITISEP